MHCAGLVSKDALVETKAELGNDIILNRVDGAELFLNGDSFRINSRGTALVIDREKFDCALGRGLDVKLNTRFLGIEKVNGSYLVETDKEEYCADIVVGADGANSSVRRVFGFKENIEYLRGVQCRIRYDKCDRNFVQVHLKMPFFAWVVPEKEGIARVGIISNEPYLDLTGFLKEKSINGEILEKFAGVVPLGKCATQKEKVFLVGDAACQVKPLTHGGIYYGMRCAEILADCLAVERPGDYEKLWRDRFSREIQIGLTIRQAYKQLSHSHINSIFRVLKENAVTLEDAVDFENHSKIISSLIKNPVLQGIFGKILIGLVRDTKINF